MKSIIEKLLKITEEIQPLTKDGTNQESKYNYVAEQTVLVAVRPLLIKSKVLLVTDIISQSRENDVTTINCKFTFICSETLESISYLWMGTGFDMQDKGLYKAITGALKYFLIKNLLIETGENTDPEFDWKKPWVKQSTKDLAKLAREGKSVPDMTEEEMDARQKEREVREERIRNAQEIQKALDAADEIPGLEKGKKNMEKILKNVNVTPMKKEHPSYPEWFDVESHVGESINAVGIRCAELTKEQVKKMLAKEPKWNTHTEKDEALSKAIKQAGNTYRLIDEEDPATCVYRNNLVRLLSQAGIDQKKVTDFAAENGWLPCKMNLALITEQEAEAMLSEFPYIKENLK